MPEQLNEREKWIALRFWCAGGGDLIGDADTFGALVEEFNDQGHKTIPPDPNLARITELEAEVERLNGLMDLIEMEIKGVYCSCDDVDPTGGYCEMCRCLGPEIRHILSRHAADEGGGHE